MGVSDPVDPTASPFLRFREQLARRSVPWSALESEPVAYSRGVHAAGIDHVEDLLLEAAMHTEGVVGEVQCLEVDVEVAGDVVTGAQIHAGRGIHEHRLR